MRTDLVIRECTTCDKKVPRKRSTPDKNTFCTKRCEAGYKNNGRIISCSFCSLGVYKSASELSKTTSGNRFCSRSCSVSFNNNKYRSGKNHPNYTGGAGSYRERALSHYGNKCSNRSCPLTEAKIDILVRMLDVDHIDGNRGNNDISNLQVLCVWCHAEKTRLPGYS